MLQLRSLVKVADNSGAKSVRVFTVLGGTRKRYAQIGDLVVASVQTAEPRHAGKAIKKKDVVKCLVVRQRHPLRRPDGSVVRFDENAVVIIDDKKQPRATRVFGPVPRELKEKGFDAVFSLAEEVV
ncbi:MAG: 50S ribosomal protein L14 [Candidatus Harrisonbacteria bacterium CG10_big_fil_rev_8_21_14_0_10_49_15]|uniref:Large ribosomal subunit protein uL14 n=1 Tax=Candidatus Harrisonbacteria bacterium CG10_big_fil_rev_8_21_14_0_10_49_15 TaxID=1974587 RepID=A0A2H0UKY4_9BACT|nr:MAG: 50S ribosomal protein L14 [Candidatus Harrisonbacteria bacterium CG10_big_fil_rev_8_21_14_0_10_49_15]